MRTPLFQRIPDQQGKYREFRVFADSGGFHRGQKLVRSLAFSENSLEIGTGNFQLVTGNRNSLICFRSGKEDGGDAVIVKMRCNLSSQVLSDTEGLSDGRSMPERIRLNSLGGRLQPGS
jgi:hypothetical protein